MSAGGDGPAPGPSEPEPKPDQAAGAAGAAGAADGAGRTDGDRDRPGPADRRRRVGLACLAVGAVVAAGAMLAIPARATDGARTTADEPQYLLSALSLAEDRDLWIDDELAEHRYEPFHEIALPVQTQPLDNGHAVSPHDPLLPVILALPMGLGGWVAAKATLAVLAGALAALLTWTAHRRLAVPLGVAAGTVLAFGLAAPLSAYATQVYPELPAALAVTVVVAALTGPGSAPGVPGVPGVPGAWWLVAAVLGIVSLPWLGVKYAPVAAVLALVLVARLWRAGRGRVALGVVGALGLAGVAYLVGHRLLYGGWTVYAAGDHFVEGELSVVGTEANYLGRSRRLVGLLLDRQFGLAAWMPGYLLAVPALAALLRRALAAPAGPAWWDRPRRRGHPAASPPTEPARPDQPAATQPYAPLAEPARRDQPAAIQPSALPAEPAAGAGTLPPGTAPAILLPLAAGWATATWVALTMHGWWWPGRQTVVVLPCLVLAVAWWLGQARARLAVAVAGVLGAVTWVWLVVEARTGRLTLIVDFETTANPLYRAWRLVLPDYRHPDAGDWALQAAWLVALGLVAAAAAHRVGRPPAGTRAIGSAPVGGGDPGDPDGVTGPSAPGRPDSTSPPGPTDPVGPIDPDSPDRRRPTHVPA